MKYALIENDIVIQIQPNEDAGFLQVEDNVVCGMVRQPDGTFKEVSGLTAEEALSLCLTSRAAAYRNESDPLKNEAEYDAMVTETAPDYTAWLAKVAEIKARYPKP